MCSIAGGVIALFSWHLYVSWAVSYLRFGRQLVLTVPYQREFSMTPDDPPRKFYGLKERAFDRVNAPPAAAAAPGAPTAAEPGAKPGRIDVYDILQENRAVEKQLGGDEIEIKEVKSRRRRDYWLLLVGGNLLLLFLVALGGFNPISLIFGFAGVVIFSSGLTWVMWSVMGKY